MLASKLLIIEKLMLGVTLAAPIGPVSIEMIRRGLRHGFWGAFSIRLGGAVGNTLCLLGTCLGFAKIMGYPAVINTLGFCGAGLLLYMGITTLKKRVDDVDFLEQSEVKNGLIWGLYLAVVNPIALVFWPGIFAASMKSIDSVSFAGVMENLLIIVGVLLWGAGLSGLLSFGNRFLNRTTINIITKLSAIFMICYGLKYSYQVYLRLL